MRLLDSNLSRHKVTFNRRRRTVGASDQRLVPRSHDVNSETGRGMTAWQRISGNVPTPYVTYAEIQLMRLVTHQVRV